MSLEDSLYPLLKLYEASPQPVKTLAGIACRVIPASLRYGKAYVRFQAEAKQVESWDAATIRNYQVEALRESLKAAAKTPFYSSKFAERGLDPAKFESLEQLADYPTLTREEVIQYRDSMVNPTLSASQRLYMTTGGSSGMPMGFHLQKNVSRAKEQAHLESMWRRVGYAPGAPMAVIRGHAVQGKSPWYYDPTRNWLIMSSSRLDARNCAAYIQEINRFRPQFIHAYPSSALLLAQHTTTNGMKLEVNIKAMLCGSEHLSDADRSWLEAVFQTKVFRWYGHSERVLLAGEKDCTGRYHFCPAYGYVEFGESNADGYREVIGTSFHNHVMPFIRYRTADFAREPLTSTDDPSSWPSVAEIAGRESEFLFASDGRRVPVTVVNRHDDSFIGLNALQFHQHELGKLEVHYVPSPRFSASMLQMIESCILLHIGQGFQLQFKAVGEVKNASLGKRRWLISTLKQNHKD